MTWRSLSVDLLDISPWNAIWFLIAGDDASCAALSSVRLASICWSNPSRAGADWPVPYPRQCKVSGRSPRRPWAKRLRTAPEGIVSILAIVPGTNTAQCAADRSRTVQRIAPVLQSDGSTDN
jgi:hypothetical protein